jgi:hypothetical protein
VTDVPQGSALASALFIPLRNDESRHLQLILISTREMPVFTRQRNRNIVFSANRYTDTGKESAILVCIQLKLFVCVTMV